jgi:diphthamide synthase (EF-2-diphthine--ammonia ligase)
VEGVSPQELDSFMFQTVGHSTLETMAECMGLPLVRRFSLLKAVQQGVHYEEVGTAERGACGDAVDHDEVEDLYLLLREVKVGTPVISATCSISSLFHPTPPSLTAPLPRSGSRVLRSNPQRLSTPSS